MKLPDNPLAKPDNAPKPLYLVPFYTLREAKTAALEIAEECNSRFDKHTWIISFPAFDLKFINYNDTAVHEHRNVIDVAELDKLLLWYRERIDKDESR